MRSAFEELVSSYHDAIGLSECEITDKARAELAALRATVDALTTQNADQARRLEEARDILIAIRPYLPISGDGYNTLHHIRQMSDTWLAAPAPAPQAEQEQAG